uniref:MSP domain-containing protein n=1 Tax=Panagrolaimus sp. ES5 TaxID=591445 RepID=A0AC34GI76_9BILA
MSSVFFDFSSLSSTLSNMASVPPGDINTQPGTKIVFNAPYDDKHTYHIKIINAGGRRIGWA